MEKEINRYSQYVTYLKELKGSVPTKTSNKLNLYSLVKMMYKDNETKMKSNTIKPAERSKMKHFLSNYYHADVHSYSSN